jgi:DMSO/TMAO reductase YedYZ molybdopterin-dependent catalytic subunit
MTDDTLSRRRLLVGGAGALLLPGCDRLNGAPAFRDLLTGVEGVTMHAQRLVTDRSALAREYRPDERSPVFRSNGTRLPMTPQWQRWADNGFADWRLRVFGRVDRPLALSLPELRRQPARTQITRHDCVEGWSAIGKWTGARLAPLVQAAGLKPDARYLVFHCADAIGGTSYYESIDLIDAFHPQTILAYDLNDEPLPVGNGAPLRLRVERQLGYKQAKYLTGIEAVARLDTIRGGKGGFWEDRAGYQWYAGI